MNDSKIERYHCNNCRRVNKHFVRGEYTKHDGDAGDWYKQRMLIIECCGCENLELVKLTLSSDDVVYFDDPLTGESDSDAKWEEIIFPPVTYRNPPPWFEDLPDPTLRAISDEIYKSLQTGSHYLATFGSRTLIDRLIVLTVGDKGSFTKGLQALLDEGKLSPHEREILTPVVDAGNAAAHRGWAPTLGQLEVILDTVEGLIHRLLVLPKLAEELEEAVPGRAGAKVKPANLEAVTIASKIKAAPKDLQQLYDDLAELLKSLGPDVTVHPQKHYIAFRRNRNFACVQIYNQKRVIRAYLNLDPDAIEIDLSRMRDVRQIGHFGTGDLEVTIKSKKDIGELRDLMVASYSES